MGDVMEVLTYIIQEPWVGDVPDSLPDPDSIQRALPSLPFFLE